MFHIPIFPVIGIIGMFFLMGCQSTYPTLSFAAHLYDESDSINGPVPHFLQAVENQQADILLWGGDVSDFGALAPSAWVSLEKKWTGKSFIAYGNHDLATPEEYNQKRIDSLPPFQFYELSDSVKLVVFQTVGRSNFAIDSVVFKAEMSAFPVQILIMHHPLFWDGREPFWKPNAEVGEEMYQMNPNQNFRSSWLPLLQQEAKSGKQIWCLAGDFGKFQTQQHQIQNGIHFLGVGGNGEKVDFLLLKPMKNRYSYQIISHP